MSRPSRHRQLHTRLYLSAIALQGGFLQQMTRREAAQILGLRESSSEQAVKEAHKRIMLANHPDSGGSSYLATKINEAKDLLLGKKSGRGMI